MLIEQETNGVGSRGSIILGALVYYATAAVFYVPGLFAAKHPRV